MNTQNIKQAIYDILDCSDIRGFRTVVANDFLNLVSRVVNAKTAALRAELEEAKAQAADSHQLRERLDQAAASYLRLINASGYSDRGDGHKDAPPEDWINEVVANREYYSECMRVNRAYIEAAKEHAAELQAARKSEHALTMMYLTLTDAAAYIGGADAVLPPEEHMQALVKNSARLDLLISEGLQVYESNSKFRLRQVVDACTVGKSYGSAREAIDAALIDGVSECQCKGETCE